MRLTSLVKRSFLGVCFLVYSFSANAQHPALGGGTGDSLSPYRIETPAHLKQLADFVNGGYNNGNATAGVYYIMINDIDLTDYAADEGWDPIGYYNTATDHSFFQGNFNGNNKKITNLKINRSTTDRQGLFSVVSGAKIENLGVENCDIIGRQFVGGLMGGNDASYISNCYATGNVSGDNDVGGLVGGNGYSSTIFNCYAAGDVSGSYNVGGLVGNNRDNSSISNCYAKGNVSGAGNAVGGLVGYNSNSSIKNCVTANDSVVSTVNTTDINRICGYTIQGTFQNNYALSTIVVKNSSGNVTITADSLNGRGGMSKLITDLQSLAFYTTVSNWNTAAWDINDPNGIWRICDGENLPFLRWQGIYCSDEVDTIAASAGAGGSISPSGAVIVVKGGSQTFTFLPSKNYKIDQVLVDGANDAAAVAAGSYTFTNVQANHKIEVSFKPTVGIKQLTIDNGQLTIYPNPTTGQLRVSGDISDGKDREIIIFDVIGQVVFTSQLSNLSPETMIDISHLANGLYFFKINNKMFKIIKE